MKISLKDFIESYYKEYQQFCKEPLIRKINKQIYQISCIGLKSLNVKPIKVNYIWDDFGNILNVNFIAYNRKNKVLYSCDIPIKRTGNDISLGLSFISFPYGEKIRDIIEKNRYEIFKLLLKYKYINESKYYTMLKIDSFRDDFIAMTREKNYISFIIYKEDKKKSSYVETMNTMAGFLKIGSKFGLYLDTGEYFINQMDNGSPSNLIGNQVNDLVEKNISNVYLVENDNLPNEFIQNISKQNLVKRRRKI